MISNSVLHLLQIAARFSKLSQGHQEAINSGFFSAVFTANIANLNYSPTPQYHSCEYIWVYIHIIEVGS